jgi:hypothetical protein
MTLINEFPELIQLNIIKYIDGVEDKLKYINAISSSSAHYDYYIGMLSNDYDWYVMRFMYDTGVLTNLAYINSSSKIYLDNYEIVKILDDRKWGWEFDISYFIFEDLISEIIYNNELINRIPESFIYANDMCEYYKEKAILERDNIDDIDNVYDYNNINDSNDPFEYISTFNDMDTDFYNFYGIDKYKNAYKEGYNTSKYVDINNKYLFVEELIEKYRVNAS